MQRPDNQVIIILELHMNFVFITELVPDEYWFQCSYSNSVSTYYFIKMHALFHYRMYAAILHFNENSSRSQAKTKTGQARCTVFYPKYKEGHVLRKILTEARPTYGKHSSKFMTEMTCK